MNWKKIFSYVWEQPVASRSSDFSGELTVQWQNGRKVLHAPDANYSFDTLHHVLQKGLQPPSLLPDDRILILGMGAGSAIEIIRNDLNISNGITAVEIDKTVIELAEEHFDLSAHDRLTYHCEDALSYVRNTENTYQWIICDIFINRRIPESIWNMDFVSSVMRVLASDSGQIFFNVMREDLQSEAGKHLIKCMRDKYNIDVRPTGYSNYGLYIRTQSNTSKP